MAIVQVELTFPNINISAQVGDNVYYTIPTSSTPIGGFNTADLSNTLLFGVIVAISETSVTVQYDDHPPHPGAPPTGAFISFAKSKKINTSSLLGYYASVKFVNDSKKTNVELFSVGAEISQSSK